MDFNERELHVIDHALNVQLKKIRKQAKSERVVFGSGHAYDELEECMIGMICRINNELIKPENVEKTNIRMARVLGNNPHEAI